MKQPLMAALPSRVNSTILMKRAKPGEPIVVVKATGIGATGTFDFRGRQSRSYLLKWDRTRGGHTLLVPHHLWMADNGRLAHDMLDQRRLSFPLIVLVELPEPPEEEVPTEETVPPETGAEGESPEEDSQVGGSATESLTDSPDTPSAPTSEGEDDEEEDPKIPLHQVIATLVADSPRRIKEVVEALNGPSEHEVRDALSDPESEAELAHAGWVRLKEPPDLEQE